MRHIEVNCDAEVAYDYAFEYAYGGVLDLDTVASRYPGRC